MTDVKARILILDDWRHHVEREVDEHLQEPEAAGRVNVNTIDNLVESAKRNDEDAGASISEKLARSRRCINGKWCREDDGADGEAGAGTEAAAAVIHLKGKRFQRGEKAKTDLQAALTPGKTTVKDWSVNLNESSLFTYDDGGIRIEETGLYFL